MFNVERILQITLSVLVISGALLLGFGHQNPSFPILISLCVVTSFILTDLLKIFWFHHHFANIAAICAAIFSVADFLRSNSDHQLMAMAGLLVYLQVILLFQQKTPRIYWQLMVLSVLQVVIASALRLEVEAGFLFVLYMFLAIITMVLMHLHREFLRMKQAEKMRTESHDSQRETQLNDRTRHLLRGATSVQYSVNMQDNRFRPEVLKQGLIVAVVGGLFASVMFFISPRSSEVWFGAERPGLTQIGFNKTISFDAIGKIETSDRTVFRTTFTDPKTDKPAALQVAAIYMRGITLNHYSTKQGVKTWLTSLREEPPSNYIRPRVAPKTDNLLVQQVVLEPITDSNLFSTFPCYRSENTPRQVGVDFRNDMLRRRSVSSPLGSGVFKYELLVDRFHNGIQNQAHPYFDGRPGMPPDGNRLLRWLTIHRREHPQLIAKATELKESLEETSSRIEIAQHISNHLRFSLEYRYTLDFSNVDTNRNIDPIEDFIANHRAGHCEYFASALALMLRSQNIPCRLVLGFKGGDYNAVGKYYEFQQKDSHAWVEVYLRPDDTTQKMRESGQAGPGGAWLRLDPTPMNTDGLDTEIADSGLLDTADDMIDYAQLWWDDFIIGYSDETTIENSRSGIVAGLGKLFNANLWDRFMTSVEEDIGIENHSDIFRAQVFLFFGFILFAIVYWNPLRIHRMRRAQKSAPILQSLFQNIADVVTGNKRRKSIRAAENRLHGKPVDFFEQFSSLMKRLGLERRSSQTQLEFVQQAAAYCAVNLANSHSSPSTPRPNNQSDFLVIAGAFYQVRFGDRALDRHQATQIEHALTSLETQVRANETSR